MCHVNETQLGAGGAGALAPLSSKQPPSSCARSFVLCTCAPTWTDLTPVLIVSERVWIPLMKPAVVCVHIYTFIQRCRQSSMSDRRPQGRQAAMWGQPTTRREERLIG